MSSTTSCTANSKMSSKGLSRPCDPPEVSYCHVIGCKRKKTKQTRGSAWWKVPHHSLPQFVFKHVFVTRLCFFLHWVTWMPFSKFFLRWLSKHVCLSAVEWFSLKMVVMLCQKVWVGFEQRIVALKCVDTKVCSSCCDVVIFLVRDQAIRCFWQKVWQALCLTTYLKSHCWRLTLGKGQGVKKNGWQWIIPEEKMKCRNGFGRLCTPWNFPWPQEKVFPPHFWFLRNVSAF